MATAAWGTGWSVPTDAQFNTLINMDDSDVCLVACETGDVSGIRITGTTDGYTTNSIFLPDAGYGDVTSLEEASDGYGYYWTSVRDDDIDEPCNLVFDIEYEQLNVYAGCHFYGCPVRPVRSSL